MRRARPTVAVVATWLLITLPFGVARAAPPRSAPGKADMVDGPVRALAQTDGALWVGGHFGHVLGVRGRPVWVVHDLAVFNSAGLLEKKKHLASFTDATRTPYVYDFSVSPGGTLYVAGAFDHVDGKVRHNVAAIDPRTGALLPFAPAVAMAAWSIRATSSAIYVGAGKLLSFQPNGTPTPGYVPAKATVDPSIRAHRIGPAFRDIIAVGSTLVSACQCDGIVDRNGSHAVKAIVEVDAASGDLRSWVPANLVATGAAFGISLIERNFPGTSNPTVFLAAGGNDFVAAYDFTTGAQRWREDTSGSAQAIAWWQDDLIVGGHFDWTQRAGSGACSDNIHPNTKCFHTPKLVGMAPSSGHVVLARSGKPWNPGICCRYNGVWTVRPGAGGMWLHVGGEFTRAGGTWTFSEAKQRWILRRSWLRDNVARFGKVRTG
jgi:hypothetical protein